MRWAGTNSQQLKSKLLVCSPGAKSLRWPKESRSEGQRRGSKKQKVKEPLAKICWCQCNVRKRAPRGTALNAKVFYLPTDRYKIGGFPFSCLLGPGANLLLGARAGTPRCEEGKKAAEQLKKLTNYKSNGMWRYGFIITYLKVFLESLPYVV